MLLKKTGEEIVYTHNEKQVHYGWDIPYCPSFTSLRHVASPIFFSAPNAVCGVGKMCGL
jgi:hypothetical protein